MIEYLQGKEVFARAIYDAEDYYPFYLHGNEIGMSGETLVRFTTCRPLAMGRFGGSIRVLCDDGLRYTFHPWEHRKLSLLYTEIDLDVNGYFLCGENEQWEIEEV